MDELRDKHPMQGSSGMQLIREKLERLGYRIGLFDGNNFLAVLDSALGIPAA